MNIVEKRKKIPLAGKTDVAVVGGGIAGCAAALAAARSGVKVILIEKESALGGLATLANVIVYLPLCDGNGNQVIGGIAEEFLKLSVNDGFYKIPDCWEANADPGQQKNSRYRVDFNPANLILELERILLDAGVEIWYDNRFCDVICDNKEIKYLLIENKSGRIALKAKNIIDCSGDADVCARAGEKTESLHTNVLCGWFFLFESENQNNIITKNYIENQEIPSSTDGRILRLKVKPLSKKYSSDPNFLPEGEKGYAGDNFLDISTHIIASRKLIREKLDELRKNSPDKKIYPGILPLLPSLRMTRRIVGKTELKIHDEFRYFEDSVGMTGDWRKKGPVFFIPLSSLTAVKNKNLCVAGKIISSAGEAWDVTRVIPVCALTGEIAGTASALAVKRKKSDISSLNIDKLRTILIKQGVIIDKSFAKK
ncbi:MAG TPA: FAD-dependent oxidoreductase [Victivallales bacterium]|nr:FAD-dependent oxidoreductase [Victivallales bacterium]HPO90115.1 FAD-dependent oxidoreductase [Victivallales bacterium]HRR27909.1 FAD-dependent oxidoreductase [Victivallales bacterium]HRU00842.1 FAD-dependent oxidoreductase [Victivallales bacterium]